MKWACFSNNVNRSSNDLKSVKCVALNVSGKSNWQKFVLVVSISYLTIVRLRRTSSNCKHSFGGAAVMWRCRIFFNENNNGNLFRWIFIYFWQNIKNSQTDAKPIWSTFFFVYLRRITAEYIPTRNDRARFNLFNCHLHNFRMCELWRISELKKIDEFHAYGSVRSNGIECD